MREGAEDTTAIRARIAAVAFPEMDPVAGRDGPLQKAWR